MHRWDSPNGVQTAPVITVSESANGRDTVKTDFAVVSLNTVLSPKWLNEGRFQIGRDLEKQAPNGPGPSTSRHQRPEHRDAEFPPAGEVP